MFGKSHLLFESYLHYRYCKILLRQYYIIKDYKYFYQDRKILRQFWNQDGMHTKDAGFHVVITSYQIVISDVKYFNRIKWQYMVLDEAQAIKSTSRYFIIKLIIHIVTYLDLISF